ncbi:DUF998 domain-containing protein [Robertkochia aurantiaca]|uniref:DUF998 domain-containing protein n=1 Tax=Robertkochia aurantiaca TaxID=2873700 RepID=UPI001CCEC5DF|nr:DUF998 domain-containing protein [Robertkochia sp. 3YJGBD-33]
MSKKTKLFLYLGIVAVILRNSFVYGIGWYRPQYSHTSDFISELSAEGAPGAGLINFFSLILVGIFIILGGIGLKSYFLKPGIQMSSIYLITGGIGYIIIGLFPCPPGCNMETDTFQMTLHLLGAFIATLSMVLSALLYGLWYFKGHPTVLRLSAFTLGCVGFLAFTALWIMFFYLAMNKSIIYEPIGGLVQRLNVAAGDLWLFLACLFALRNEKRTPQKPGEL